MGDSAYHCTSVRAVVDSPCSYLRTEQNNVEGFKQGTGTVPASQKDAGAFVTDDSSVCKDIAVESVCPGKGESWLNGGARKRES